MTTTRVAFAGLSPLREHIVREALARAGPYEVVAPWTSLAALGPRPGGDESPDILFLELSVPRLPDALRGMLAGASHLRIVGLAVDAGWAAVFEMRERHTMLLRCVADDLCTALGAATDDGLVQTA